MGHDRYEILSQPALHDYIEITYVLPKLAQIFGSEITPSHNQYHEHAKNCDRKFETANGDTITIERKHDGSSASPDIAFEIFCNLKLGNWNEFRGRLRKNNNRTLHSKIIKKIGETCGNPDFNRSRNAGLLTAKIPTNHFTLMVRHYPDRNRSECWLLKTRWLQQEVVNNIQNLDIGKVHAYEHGNKWDTILTFVSMPSLVRNDAINIDGDCIVGNWDITDVYPLLVDKKEIPAELSNTK